jgi:DNA sulfur modification protein DndB
MEKTSIPNRSNRLHTLSSIYQATRTLLGKSKKCTVSPQEEQLAGQFWEAVGKSMPDWQLAAQKKVSCAELRRDYIHAHGIALQALGIAGASLIAEHPRDWLRRLSVIEKIDWARSNTEVWEGRALVNGRVSKANTNVLLAANLVKQQLGLDLSAKEKQLESLLQRGRNAA